MRASHILRLAAEVLESHQSGRDANDESSVALAARMFSVWKGVELTERDAAVFMVLLKLARAERSHNPDNWLDGAAYVAMAGSADEANSRVSVGADMRPRDPDSDDDSSHVGNLHRDPRGRR